MGRSPCCFKEGLNRGAWTAVEDEILASYVRSHGEGKWSRLPKRAGLKRCGKSCRLRWLNYLRPDIKRGNISEQEEDLIIRLHKLLGNRWSLIAGRLPGRTDNEVKNYWNTTLWKKVQGQPLRSPKPNRTMKDNQRKPTARKLLAEVAPEPPMGPSESAEDVTRANFTTCNEHVPHHDRQLVAPFNGGQALSPATAKLPAISGESSLPDHTSNDLITGLDLRKDMCTWCPPESSIVLVDDGAGEEARNGAGGEEGNGYKDAAMPDNSHGMLLDRAALGGWLEADISQPDPFSLSDLQLLASFLNLEEWQM